MPSIPDDATADTAVFLIIGALRGFSTSMLALREGKWRGQPAPPLGHDPQGKVLGVLGMGGIGRNMKKKCEAFGMKTIYHNRSKLSEEMAGGAQYVSFEELLAKSDVLSLNLPLNVSMQVNQLLDKALIVMEEKHSPHHLHGPVRQDEEGRHHREHGERCSDGRRRARQGARVWPCGIGWS